MRYFDPHIHMTSRTTDDYEAMAAAGVRAIIEPAFWLGQPRTTLGAFTDYYASESGTPLRRWFLSLEQPLADADLAGLFPDDFELRGASAWGARETARSTSGDLSVKIAEQETEGDDPVVTDTGTEDEGDAGTTAV